MKQRVLIVNPNCLQTVTDSMSAALEGYRFPGGPQIECATLKTGPPGIETQAHVDCAAKLLFEWFAEKPARRQADAVVVGCFSDPGLFALREALPSPVFGIGESSYLCAAALGERFGVIAIMTQGISRHRRAQHALGLQHKLAGELAIDLGVAELSKEGLVWKRMRAVGKKLRDEHGADVLIMGCAGMARYRDRLEDHLRVPVIDPTQAAVGMALGVLLAKRAAGGGEKRVAA